MGHRKNRSSKKRAVQFERASVTAQPECLEPRLLLYAPTGGAWSHPELVTLSFMPDGTDVGGTPSTLQRTLDNRWSFAAWQKEILRGMQSWAAVSNLDFSLTTDDGSAFGSAGGTGSDNNVQGDSNFGDIRIGGIDLGSYLGVGMLPPPINGDTTAGDFFLNTAATWNSGSQYDLATVSTHETGHVLGLDHSSASSAEMYTTYNGTKTNLTNDDIAGIQSIYGARQKDQFDVQAANNSKGDATVITSSIDSNKQVSISNLDITSSSDVDFYKITIPSGITGSMSVKLQATGFSLLAPKLSLYNSGGNLITSVSGSYGSTVQLGRSVSAGQVYYIAADGADSSVFGIGGYALQVNLGSTTQAPASSPNTAVAASGDGGSAAGMSSDSPSLTSSLLHTVTSLVTTATTTLTDGLKLLTDLIGQGKAEADLMSGAHDSHGTHHITVSPSCDGGESNANDFAGTDEHGPSANHVGATRSQSHLGLWYRGHGRADAFPLAGSPPDRHTASKVFDNLSDTDPLEVRRAGFELVRELSGF